MPNGSSRIGRALALTLASGVACGVVLGLAPVARAQVSYSALPVGTLGGASSQCYGVNDAGVAVGAANTLDGSVHAFVFSEGVMTDLGTRAGDVESTAYAINDAGLIVGESRDASNVLHPVYWTLANGVWSIHPLPTLGGSFGTCTRVNAVGQIAGYTSPATGGYHAVIWTNGVPADLGTLTYTGTLAYSQCLGLNDAGDAVGYAYRVLGGPEHGFVKPNGGRQTDITPAGSNGPAQGHNINATGYICGHINGPGGAFRAALRDPATAAWTLMDLLPSHTDSFAYDLSNANEVVGVSFEPSSGPGTGDAKAFLWRDGVTYDLNLLTTGVPSQLIEARDITPGGLIAATASDGASSVGVILMPRHTIDCDPDLNQDGNADQDDVRTLVDIIAGGPNPTGVDPDFNHDGNADQDDVRSLVDVVAGGPCP